MIFVIGPIATVLLSKAATAEVEGAEARSRTAFVHSFYLAALVLLGAAGMLSLFAPWAMLLLTGSENEVSVHHLRIAVWCLIPTSLSQLAIPFFFGQRREGDLFGFFLIACLIPIGIGIYARDVMSIFYWEGVVGCLLLGYVFFRAYRKRS
jgi:O-antigen/teichoic acid export membrane protein